MKRNKKRKASAKSFVMTPAYRMQVVRDRTKYKRKSKHRKMYA